MEAIREIREITSDTITIRIPRSFHNQRVEIIVLPLGEADQPSAAWPVGFLEKFAGSIPDFPDIPAEPALEVRKPL